METADKSELYRVWGAEKVAYGPLDLLTLVQWIQDGRVTTNSWVLFETDNQWHRVAEVPKLKGFFPFEAPSGSVDTTMAARAKQHPAFTPEALRRIKLFDRLEGAQLQSLLHYLEVVPLRQFSHIVREGQLGDAMYIVLEGEVRALKVVEGKESLLATLTAGDCFGEISLLDQGPRSADVIANKDSILLKLSSEGFERLVREAPALSVPFLLALCRAVVFRIRRTTKKYEDSIRFIRSSVVQ
jgi:hypothetical protein